VCSLENNFVLNGKPELLTSVQFNPNYIIPSASHHITIFVSNFRKFLF
jgi:hypothetical protein